MLEYLFWKCFFTVDDELAVFERLKPAPILDRGPPIAYS